MFKYPEPVTDLLLDKGADGFYRYHVIVPVRIAEEIGGAIGTLQQFLDAIETRGEYAEFEVLRIDGAELRAWKDCFEELNTKA